MGLMGYPFELISVGYASQFLKTCRAAFPKPLTAHLGNSPEELYSMVYVSNVDQIHNPVSKIVLSDEDPTLSGYLFLILFLLVSTVFEALKVRVPFLSIDLRGSSEVVCSMHTVCKLEEQSCILLVG